MTIAEEADKLAKTFGIYKNDLPSQGIAELARLVERLASEVRITRPLDPDLTMNRIAARAGAYLTAMTFATLVNSGAGLAEVQKAYDELTDAADELLEELERPVR